MVLKNADWSDEYLQVRTSANSRFHFELVVPEVEEAAWSVLRSVTAAAQLSDKGRLAHAVESVSSVDVAIETGVLPVVSKLTTPRSKELRRGLRRLRDAGHDDADLVEMASSWGGRSQRRHRSADNLRAKVGDDAFGAAEVLVSRNWAERGFEIRCDQCTIRSFVPLADVAAEARCPARGAVRVFEGERAPSINYRLNGLIDRASDQGVLPHVMAQAALVKHDPDTRLLLGVCRLLRRDEG